MSHHLWHLVMTALVIASLTVSTLALIKTIDIDRDTDATSCYLGLEDRCPPTPGPPRYREP